ncbi:MAG TPA: hypothetical protein VGC52_10650 [Gemmatimonadaceae bacterium]
MGRSRRGASRLGCLIQIAIVAMIVYFGLLAGEEALAYYRFKDAMKNEARFASIRSDTEIRNRLRVFADSVELPAQAKEVRIVREGNRIRIWSEYDQVFKLPLNKTRVVHFRPSVEKTF